VRLLLLLPFAASGCIADVLPDTGPPQRERCVNEDSDPDHDVSFQADVLDAIFRGGGGGPGCACHDPTQAAPIGIEIGGLSLADYASLRAGGVNSGAGVVVPGDACGSAIVMKVGDGPPFGSRMPFNGPPFLSAADQQVIRDWIVEGALEN
jgi:hypothetical protein